MMSIAATTVLKDAKVPGGIGVVTILTSTDCTWQVRARLTQKASIWKQWRGFEYSLKTTTMKIRPTRKPLNE